MKNLMKPRSRDPYVILLGGPYDGTEHSVRGSLLQICVAVNSGKWYTYVRNSTATHFLYLGVLPPLRDRESALAACPNQMAA